MQLILTQYVDATPDSIERDLSRFVSTALDAAADRVDAGRVQIETQEIERGLRVVAGLGVLDGSEVRVSGDDHLSAIEVVVPWSRGDAEAHKLLAVNRFAWALVDEVDAAAA